MKTIRFLFVLLFMAQLLCMDAQNLQYGLKACYPFDSPGGTYEPNMAATGTALDAVPVNVTSVPGVTGTGYAFAGTPNSFIQLPNNAMIKPSNALSFSGWVKFNAVGTGQYIVFTHNTCTYYFEAYALVAGQVGSNFVFQVVKPGATACASQHILNGTTNLQPNTWYHVGFYVGTDAIKLYVNGVLESQMASTTSFNYGSNPVYLGGTNDVIANAPFGGIMDNVRFMIAC